MILFEVRVMELVQLFLWIVYPYSVAVIMAMALVWHYDSDSDDRAATRASRYLSCTVKALMLLSTGTGISIFLSGSISDEPVQLLRLMVSSAQLQPEMGLVLDISILSKVHFFLVFLFLLSLAFTKEFYYLLKPHLYVRKLFLKLNFEKKG
jgi:nitrate reductase gamma subunit